MEIILGFVVFGFLALFVHLHEKQTEPVNKKRADDEFINVTTCKKCGSRNYKISCTEGKKTEIETDRDGYNPIEVKRDKYCFRIYCLSCNNEIVVGDWFGDSEYERVLLEDVKKYLDPTGSTLRDYLRRKDYLTPEEELGSCAKVFGKILLIILVLGFVVTIVIGLTRQ